MSDITREARELLDGITSGEWMVDADDPTVIMRPDNPPSTWDGLLVARVRGGLGNDIDSLPEYADAAFIAAAPRLVRELLAENQRLTAQRRVVVDAFKKYQERSVAYAAQAQAEPAEAQAWDAWFAAERDFYLRDYDENAKWMHRRIRRAEAALDRVRELARRLATVDTAWHTDYIHDKILAAIDGEGQSSSSKWANRPHARELGQEIYRNTPNEPGATPREWGELEEHEREAWYINAANLGRVFPNKYPDIADENRHALDGEGQS